MIYIFRYRFTKYLKKNCGLGSDEHDSFIYVTKNALVRTLKEITKIVTAFLAATGKIHAILLKLVSFLHYRWQHHLKLFNQRALHYEPPLRRWQTHSCRLDFMSYQVKYTTGIKNSTISRGEWTVVGDSLRINLIGCQCRRKTVGRDLLKISIFLHG